ncbi:YdeI family protein [Nemorincola caseinilytica]|uniref:YdeI family protein n=1 Tax=Nemorincola caseinilytica TaxID=2054315 RepID=A0ABP8NJP4_9BACT
MNAKVNFFFDKATQWQEELRALRKIALDSGLEEELKWGCPCYTRQKGNVVLIHAFKEYCALLFFKGALMPDPDGILIQQTKNVQAARQMRFTNVKEIKKLAPAIKEYIREAIKVEQAGLKVALKKTAEFDMPEELQRELDKDADLKAAFHALTPGRQRAYMLHISSGKQVKTREARVQKYIPHILDGKGMDDE